MSIYTASGEIELTPHGFSTLSYKFPLKLMPAFSRHVSNKVDSGNSGANSDDREATHNQFTSALAFILSFGGGLVGGDEIMLSVDVASLCCLTLLTQGNTKVFKKRPSRGLENKTTMQAMSCTVAPNADLILLPAPVTCFAQASYNQYQRFVLQCSKSSNLVLLDSVTSGRASRGEVWQLESYYSLNEIWYGDTNQRVARDAVLLQQPDLDLKKMVYDTYGTLFLCGPRTQPLINHWREMQETLFKHPRAPGFIWSLSVLDNGCALVRVAGQSPEEVKDFLKDHLRRGGLEEWLGPDVFRNAWV